ncbi:MAG: M23 family metallopeptidase [Candidatus Blackburnbacteria bacterium]|nr:M23 family metallopeptidase [Candidatus Blackburnbacteria bacterium]
MIQLSTNLLGGYRFRVQVIKQRRNASYTSFFPKWEDIKNTRSGSKISRFFRHFFEKGNLRSLVGKNLAAAVVVASVATPGLGYIPRAQNTTFAEVNTLSVDQPLSTDIHLQYPVEFVTVNQGYFSYHPGIDLKGKVGDPIRPVMDGKVMVIENSRLGYGKSVVVDHLNGYGSRYAHLSKIYVSEGQDVDTRTTIGEVGTTGRVTGPHLHLEIYGNGRTISPVTFLPPLTATTTASAR